MESMQRDAKQLGLVARDRRRSLGLTQQEVVDAANDIEAGWLSEPTYRNIETGRTNASDRTLTGASRGLQWPADALQRIRNGEDPAAIATERSPFYSRESMSEQRAKAEDAWPLLMDLVRVLPPPAAVPSYRAVNWIIAVYAFGGFDVVRPRVSLGDYLATAVGEIDDIPVQAAQAVFPGDDRSRAIVRERVQSVVDIYIDLLVEYAELADETPQDSPGEVRRRQRLWGRCRQTRVRLVAYIEVLQGTGEEVDENTLWWVSSAAKDVIARAREIGQQRADTDDYALAAYSGETEHAPTGDEGSPVLGGAPESFEPETDEPHPDE